MLTKYYNKKVMQIHWILRKWEVEMNITIKDKDCEQMLRDIK